MTHQPRFNGAGWDDPALVETVRGLWPACGLQRSDGAREDENELCRWVEYRLAGEVVHRSVHLTLKQTPDFTEAAAAELS